MISKYLGEDVFIDGVRQYLKKHAYGNTETSDLWAALEDVSGKPVQQVMEVWTKNVGFPVLTVTENAGSNIIKLRQNRFLRTGDVKPEEDKILYPVFLGLPSLFQTVSKVSKFPAMISLSSMLIMLAFTELCTHRKGSIS